MKDICVGLLSLSVSLKYLAWSNDYQLQGPHSIIHRAETLSWVDLGFCPWYMSLGSVFNLPQLMSLSIE